MRTARILLCRAGGARAGQIAGQVSACLGARGYRRLRMVPPHEALEQAHRWRPHLLVLVQEGGSDHAATEALLAGLRADPDLADMPVLAIGAPAPTSGTVDGWLAAPDPEAALLARASALLRLSLLQDELARRLRAGRRLGLPAMPEPAPAPAQGACALLAGQARHRDLLAAACAPERRVVHLPTPKAALAFVTSRACDAILLDVGDNDAAALDFCARVRQESDLFHLPIVILTGSLRLAMAEEVFAAGASDVLHGVPEAGELRRRLDRLVQHCRGRAALERRCRAAHHLALTDDMTDLRSHDFLRAYLAESIDDALAQDEPLSVLHLALRPGGILSDPRRDHLLRQVGARIGRAVRGADLCARDGEGITVVLPATDSLVAALVRTRLVAVLDGAPFSGPDGTPLAARFGFGLSALRPGDDPPFLLARAKAAATGQGSGGREGDRSDAGLDNLSVSR